jgi:hypothetical protein
VTRKENPVEHGGSDVTLFGFSLLFLHCRKKKERVVES